MFELNTAKRLARKRALLRALARRVGRYVAGQRADLDGTDNIDAIMDRESKRLIREMRIALGRCEHYAFQLRDKMENR